MAFNGSGTFVRLYDWTTDRDASVKIRADRMDDETDGIATGLTLCITKDGQTTVTANLPMATKKHTGVGDASARDQYLAAGQLVDGEINWIDAGGTVDAITGTFTPTITTLVDGMLVGVRAAGANATTTPTFKADGTTAQTITKHGAAALVVGDIIANGHELLLRYRTSDTKWELLNPAYSVPAITSTDNALARYNGTAGILQNSSWILDDSAVLTAAGKLAMVDKIFSRPQIEDYAETVNALGSLGGGTDDIDLTLGNVVSATVDTGTETFTFSNPPASGKAGSFTLFLINGGSQTVNWPSSVDWQGGLAPTLTTSGLDILVFTTIDGGTIWHGMLSSRNSS